jgi:hypothetical protein
VLRRQLLIFIVSGRAKWLSTFSSSMANQEIGNFSRRNFMTFSLQRR